MMIHLIKPKSKILELILVIILTFILHFFFTYHLITVKDDNVAYLILGILIKLFITIKLFNIFKC